jgi:aryl-alcohol dehydrogenase-like predicted oxidoreductase
VRVPRRRFLAMTAGAVVGGTLAACRGTDRRLDPAPPEETASASAGPAVLGTRALGKTGFEVTLLGLGGQGVIERRGREADAIALIRHAVELGVNYFDTAVKYGPSRDNLGRALEGERDRVFLASKVHARDGDGAWRQLEESLKLLRTDRVDLLQIHDVKPGDLEPVFSKDGVYGAMTRMREQGLVRYCGITGHTEPMVLHDAIRREPFDSVLMALNCADTYYLPFGTGLLTECNRQGIGVVVMKVLARGAIFREGGMFHGPGVRTIDEAIHYVLSRPVSAALVGCDTIAQLEENVASARRFRPLAPDEMKRLESLTRPYAREASYFKDWYRISRWERLPYIPFFDRKPPGRI